MKLVAPLLLIVLSYPLSSSAQVITGSGEAAFFDSTSYSDGLRLQMTGVSAPSQGTAFFAWLVNDNETEFRNLGQLTISGSNSVTLRHRDPTGANLIGKFKKLLISQETLPFSASTPTLSKVHFADSLHGSGVPSSTSPLQYIRNVISTFSNTAQSLGLAVWLKRHIDRNNDGFLNHAGFARDDANANNEGGAKSHADHVYDFVQGNLTGLVSGNSSAANNGDPVGYGYRRYGDLGTQYSSSGGAGHFVKLTVDHPNATPQMKLAGARALICLRNAFGVDNASGWGKEIVDQALRIAGGNYAQGTLPQQGGTLFSLVKKFLEGTIGPTDTSSATGGILQAYYHAQRMATFKLVAPTARLELSKTTINFDTVTVNSSKSDSVLVQNTGKNALAISSVTVTGQWFSATPSSATIPIGESRWFKVTYAPAAQGVHSGQVVFSSSAPSQLDTIKLAGVSAPPPTARLELSLLTLKFDTIAVNSSKRDSVLVRNTGQNILTVSSVNVTGQWFSAAPSSATIPIGGNQWFNVTYAPAVQGAHSGQVVFSSNAPSQRDTLQVVGFGGAPSSVERDVSRGIPQEFSLLQNFPNPFNPSTVIPFDIPVTSRVWLRIYDIGGKEIALLLDGGLLSGGSYKVDWNAHTPSGVYLYEFRAIGLEDQEFYSKVGKMVLIR